MGERRDGRGWGWVWRMEQLVRAERRAGVAVTCPACRQQVMMEGRTGQPWAVLGVFPLWPKGERVRFSACGACGAEFGKPVEAWVREDGPVSFQAAIVLFNELRERPKDGETLARLMRMYLQLGEPREATAAARTYPAAAWASDECLAILAALSYQQGQMSDALKFAEGALAVNPRNANAGRLWRDLAASGAA